MNQMFGKIHMILWWKRAFQTTAYRDWIKKQRERRYKEKKIIFKSKKELGKGSFIKDIRNIHKHPILVEG